jgi:hypothetical protein
MDQAFVCKAAIIGMVIALHDTMLCSHDRATMERRSSKSGRPRIKGQCNLGPTARPPQYATNAGVSKRTRPAARRAVETPNTESFSSANMSLTSAPGDARPRIRRRRARPGAPLSSHLTVPRSDRQLAPVLGTLLGCIGGQGWTTHGVDYAYRAGVAYHTSGQICRRTPCIHP